jgi:hypothetical protein
MTGTGDRSTSLRLRNYQDVYLSLTADNQSQGIRDAIETKMEGEGLDPDLWNTMVQFLLNGGMSREEITERFDTPEEVLEHARERLDERIASAVDEGDGESEGGG